jgi:peptidoglycan/xylan/chitin deacetylase (PgdA/CDA1 family)
MLYKFFIKTPSLAKRFFSSYVWSFSTEKKEVYLTFDDGPHPTITPFVLEQLKQYNALATFFCIGNNVEQYPDVYQQILSSGHAVGNHTYDHPNGWMISSEEYLNSVANAAKHINSNLFRPPYGKIRTSQAKSIDQYMNRPAKIIMWDVISGDFDESLTGEQCLQNIILNVKEGSIIVLHDSQKAFSRLEFFLPSVLSFFEEKGYQFTKLESF